MSRYDQENRYQNQPWRTRVLRWMHWKPWALCYAVRLWLWTRRPWAACWGVCNGMAESYMGHVYDWDEVKEELGL